MAKEILGEQLSLNLKRFYPVAPEKVWRAWIDPKALGQWFRPDASFSIPVAEADVRVGGRCRILMVNGKGEEFDLNGIYREVVPKRKLVISWCWPRTTPDSVSQISIMLRPEGGGTDFEFRHEQFFDEAARDGHKRGWTATVDKRETFLQGD